MPMYMKRTDNDFSIWSKMWYINCQLILPCNDDDKSQDGEKLQSNV